MEQTQKPTQVAIFEDSTNIRNLVKAAIERDNNYKQEVVAEAETLEEALDTLDNAASSENELAIDVLILDGNLTQQQISGDDAKEIVYRIQELKLPTKIIGFSQQPFESFGLKPDYDHTKAGPLLELPGIINSLHRPE